MSVSSDPGCPGSDFGHVKWQKSSWSSFNGNCVEVAELRRGELIGVRDTKDAGRGPVLVFEAADWGSFLETVKKSG